jgi:radical SAM protein with 4Fe4S-binding SPASM domain
VNKKTKNEIFQTTIKSNIERKSVFIDRVQMNNGIPLFSWVDINPTELCNRKCEFCPRADDAEYPNQHLHISLDLCNKINQELTDINYEGGIVLSGYGEPMLHPKFSELVKILGNGIQLELVTNGDKVTSKLARELFNNGLDLMIISMYDGPEQIEKFTKIFEEAGISDQQYILRDRWYSIDEDYGVKLTNRAGVVSVGKQEEVDINKSCHYPFYSMMLDWNGDVMLCVQDWNKKVKMGNIALESMLDVWNSKGFRTYRKMLKTKRTKSPCNTCNTNGTLHGFNHIKAWGELF